MALRRAKKSSVKLKIGLAGPSGSGKTMSALLLAKGLVGSLDDVGVLDTEGGSSDLYASLGNYVCEHFEKPFDPNRYIKAIDLFYKEGIKCMIIDSVSHEWDGPGGCLEIHQRLGGQFNHWAKVTPIHRAFIEAINKIDMHVITTARKKQDYVIELNAKGKNEPRKVGLKDVQRDGFEYELSCAFNINMDHMAIASKDRTGLFSTDIPFLICEDTGKMLREWNKQ